MRTAYRLFAPVRFCRGVDLFCQQFRLFGAVVKILGTCLIVLFVPLLSAILASKADDLTFTSDVDRYSIRLPGHNWQKFQSLSGRSEWGASNSNNSKKLTVIVKAVGSADADMSNPDAQRILELGATKGGKLKKVRSATTVVDGRPAYRLVLAGISPGGKRSMVELVVGSSGKLYAIEGLSFVDDADTDPEINAGINSFHLLDPPDHEVASTVHNSPASPVVPSASENEHIRAFNDGKKVGRVVAAIMALVLTVALIKKYAFKRRKAVGP